MRNRLLAWSRTAAPALARLAALIDLRDVITFGGLVMVGYGLHSIYPPAGWIACGSAFFWLGVRR